MYSKEGMVDNGATPLIRYNNLNNDNINHFTHPRYGKIIKKEPHYVNKTALNAMMTRAQCDGIDFTHPFGKCPDCKMHLTLEQLKNRMSRNFFIPLEELNLLDTEEGCHAIIAKYNLSKGKNSHLLNNRLKNHVRDCTPNCVKRYPVYLENGYLIGKR